MKTKVDACAKKRFGKNITIGENRRFVKFTSKKVIKLDEIKIDGCVFPKGKPPERCDFLAITQEGVYYFI